MRNIPLTQGKFAFVDDEDFEWLMQWKWRVDTTKGYYAIGRPVKKFYANGKKISMKMHRFIMNAPSDIQVDHINGDGLDNRRCNLRLATHGQNCVNSRKRKDAVTSKYKGVSWISDKKKWAAQISINKKYMFLGYFKDEVKAALAYNNAVKKYRGEFGRLNEVET